MRRHQQNLVGPSVLFQAVWLDADKDSVAAAEAAGMEAILVENLNNALDKLASLTGVQVQMTNHFYCILLQS